MSKHTPGPWKVNYAKFNEVKTSDGARVATCSNLNGLVNLQANARLIAAAPELLDALIECLECEFAVTDKSAIAKAQAAIAKATGANNGN